jgi:DNA repair protein RadD
MILRDYQSRLTSRAVEALGVYGNTLAVSPTGSGKTVMLSALVKDVAPKRTIILQHRDELTAQNLSKFSLVHPRATTSLFNASEKSWDGQAVFAMVQTLCRHAEAIPATDLLVIDEAHHAVAPSYTTIIDAVREKNPSALIAGFTATPSRGDGKGMRRVFSNVCDQITMDELIAEGHLVPPRAFVLTLPGIAQELEGVRRSRSGEFDLEEVETVMDKEVHHKKMVEEWQRLAAGRKTIVFCSTVKHAHNVTIAFQRAGIKAETVWGEMSAVERETALRNFDQGDTQILVNVSVLTEGYDSQPCSCVVLLRPCSYKSTLLQMVGRGLRTVDPELYPGVVKTDCLILDFGTSLATHGDLVSRVRMDDRETGDAPTKECPECQAAIPLGCGECPICGYEFVIDTGSKPLEVTQDVHLLEVKLFKKSPFKWIDLFASGKVMMASGFSAWVGVFSPDGNKWTAVGQRKGERPHMLSVGDKIPALAKADDFLRLNEDDDTAKKSKRWLKDPASPKQWELLERVGFQRDPMGLSFTKYTAACALNFRWNIRSIEGFLQ